MITIISVKNTANDSVPLSECFSVTIPGIVSSMTRNVIAPPANAITCGRITGNAFTPDASEVPVVSPALSKVYLRDMVLL